MYKKELDKFFKQNGKYSKIPSACAMFHFKLTAAKGLEKIMPEMHKYIFAEQPYRKATIGQKEKEISSLKSATSVLQHMRRGVDTIVEDALIQKALEFEKDLLPEVLKRLRTNKSDFFIEVALHFLALSKTNWASEWIKEFDNVENPYTQGYSLVALGNIADESIVPWLQEKYLELQDGYPDKTYCEGALFGLDLIYSRFYENKIK